MSVVVVVIVISVNCAGCGVSKSLFALGKFGEHSGGSSNSYAFFVLSKLPACSISRHTHADA